MADSYHQQLAPKPLTSSMSHSHTKEVEKGVYHRDNDDAGYLNSHRDSESVQPQRRTSSFQHRARRSGVFTPPHPRRVPKPLTLRSPAISPEYRLASPSPSPFEMGNISKSPRDAHNPAERWKTAALRSRQAKRYSSSRPPSVLSPRYSSNKRASLVKPRNSVIGPLSKNRAHCGLSPSQGPEMDSPASIGSPPPLKSSASEQSVDQCQSASRATAHRRFPSIDTASNYSLESDQGPDDGDLSITIVEEPIPSPNNTPPMRGHADVDSNATVDLPVSPWTTRPLNSPGHSVSTINQSPNLARTASSSAKSSAKPASPSCSTPSAKLVKKKRHATPCSPPKSPGERKTKTLKARRSLSQFLLRRKTTTVRDVVEEEFCGLKGFHESLDDDETEELQLDGDNNLTEHTSPMMRKVINFQDGQSPHSEAAQRCIQPNESNDLKQGGEDSPVLNSSIDLTSTTENILPLRAGRRPSLPESPAPKPSSKKLNVNSSPSLIPFHSNPTSPVSQPAKGLAPDLKRSDSRSNHVQRTHSFQSHPSAPGVSRDMSKSSLSQSISKALERSFSQSHLQKNGLDVEKTRFEKVKKRDKEISKRDSGAGRAGVPSPDSRKAKIKEEPIARNLLMFWKKNKTSSICSEMSGTTTSTESIGGRRTAVLKISDPIPITLVPQDRRDTSFRLRESSNEKTAVGCKQDNPNLLKRGKSSQNSVSLLQQQISLTRTRSDMTHFTPPHPTDLAPSLPEITRSNSLALSLSKPPRPPRRRPVAAA